MAGPGPRRVMSVRENIINRLRGNSQGNFTVMLNPMGISTNIFQIQFAKNFHVRFWKYFSMVCTRCLATTWHSPTLGQMKRTCHVATCLSGEPPWKWYVGALGAVWHKNGTRQEHQMSAVGKWMSQASWTRGHVAHVLLHVRPQGVIFVLNVTNTWHFWTASGSLLEIVGTNGRWGDGPVPEAVSPRGARDHLGSSVAEIFCP